MTHSPLRPSAPSLMTGAPGMAGMLDHPILGAVNYEAYVVPEDPDAQVERTIGLMARYANEDAASPEIRHDAQEIKWRAGMGANQKDLVREVWGETQCKIKFMRDEAMGSPVESFLSQTYGAVGNDPVVEILIRPRDIALLAPQARIGDCDDYSMYAASLLIALGIPCAFVTVAGDMKHPMTFSHVYVAAYPDGERVPVDASHGTSSGWEAKDVIPVGRIQEWPLNDPMKNCTGLGVGSVVGLALAGAAICWIIMRAG